MCIEFEKVQIEEKMKKIILTILVLCCFMSNLQADYQDNWVKGLEYYHEDEFEQAEKEFTKAINQLEFLNDISQPSVYIDRSEVYGSLERYKEALVDLNNALSSDKLTNKERVRGLSNRIFTCMSLGLDYSEDSKEFESICPDIPYEINDKCMIIKNVPDNEILREMMSKYLIGSGFCESEQNIKTFESGIMVIEKSENGWGKNLIIKENEKI